MTSHAGARWLAEDRGIYDFPQSGQDVSASAYLPDPESQRNTVHCPLYPLPEIARIDWASLFALFPHLKRGSIVC